MQFALYTPGRQMIAVIPSDARNLYPPEENEFSSAHRGPSLRSG
jgi:hypothetical protein